MSEEVNDFDDMIVADDDPRLVEGKNNEENKKKQRGQQHIHSNLNRYLICSPIKAWMHVCGSFAAIAKFSVVLPRGGLEWTRACINEVIAVPNCRSNREMRSSL